MKWFFAKELDKKRIEKSNNDWRYHISSTYRCENCTQYRETVIHVNDASRAVTVAGSLLNK
jgi:5-methyltetrahydrofolate--homocysteine methyltransferase